MRGLRMHKLVTANGRCAHVRARRTPDCFLPIHLPTTSKLRERPTTAEVKGEEANGGRL